MQHQKAKSAPKKMLTRGPELQRVIRETMKTCSDLVGSTLGPGGLSVIIERQEELLPPFLSKDGVTAFNNMGFQDSVKQVIMESARDCSVRTAASAGDGTTSSAILAEAIVRYTQEYCERNPKVSPQRVVRTLEAAFKNTIEPAIHKSAKKVSLSSKQGRKLLHAVAKVSANGDKALADAVLECFDLTGDKGNITVVEESGPAGYRVDKIDGYQISTGYEDACGKFYQNFINDVSRQLCSFEKPSYILYHGKLNDIYDALKLFDQIIQAAQVGQISQNVVFVSCGVSESVLGHLSVNFREPGSLNVYPLTAPLNQMQSGQYDFLADLAAVTGGVIFDPINKPLSEGQVEDLGHTPAFEAARFRSTIIGFADELRVLERVDQLSKQLEIGGLSKLDQHIVSERLGKVSGGVARLTVVGASGGELREKRDRVDDAICAVRGAIEHGALPAGGWMLLQLQSLLTHDAMLREVLVPSLQEPINRLYMNAGYHIDEVEGLISAMRGSKSTVYDILEGEYVDAFKEGLLDSVPAVLEAIRNSISIASLLGTCGGVCVFVRDTEVDHAEARDSANYMRTVNDNPADDHV